MKDVRKSKNFNWTPRTESASLYMSMAKHAKKKLFERVKLKWQHFAVILNYKSVVCVCLGVEH